MTVCVKRINKACWNSYTVTGHRTSFAKDKTELGRSDFVQHDIDTGDARPVSQRFYRTSPEKRNEIDRQVFELLQLGRIEPSTSEWRAPVVLVKKADGTWRLCCDYRKLNSVTWPQSFPLSLLEDVWDAIGEKKAQVLSCLDLRNGFWQLEMASGAKHSQNIVCYPNRSVAMDGDAIRPDEQSDHFHEDNAQNTTWITLQVLHSVCRRYNCVLGQHGGASGTPETSV